MKIAAIDIGSNSIHMVIVEVSASGAFRVVDQESEMVRLGAGTLSTGVLTEEAMQRALTILRAYCRLAAIQGVEETIAVATSAIREASNGEDFLERIGRKVGIWPRAISGEEEAFLVYLAALHSIHLGKRKALVIDIGGGSLELALGRGRATRITASEKLGVLRMTERFVKNDPITPDDEQRLVRHVRKTLGPIAKKIRGAGFDVAIGTSGTILALGRLVLEWQNGARPDTVNHVSVSTKDLATVRHRLTRLDMRSRLRLPGLDRRRADIIPAGAIVLGTALDMLGVSDLMMCEWALREGILLDYIGKHPATLKDAEEYPDVRRRSVLQLAERCACDDPHSRHVAQLALSLFDGTRRHHGLGSEERALLEYAAWLHNAGYHVSHAGHHKHTYYLIKNGGLRGFDPREIELIALVARSYRTGAPKRKHPNFAALPRPARTTVQILSGLLRLADGLDRGHRQRVRSVAVSSRKGALTVHCRTSGVSDLEIWAARKRLEPLAKILGAELSVEIERAAPRTAQRTAARRSRGGSR